MKAKKLVAMLASAALLFGFAACSGSAASSTATAEDADPSAATVASEPATGTQSADSDKIAAPSTIKDGVLSVGVEIPYPPMEIFADDGVTPMGFDIDLAEALAEKFGLQVEFNNVAWDGIFDGLKVDKYDVVISACTITPERKEAVDFSDPYFENYQTISVMPDSDKEINDIKDVNGLKVGYQNGTSADEYLNDLIDAGEIQCETAPYAKMTEAFSDLKLGRIDAVICDTPVASSYVKDPDFGVVIKWTQPSDPEYFGVAIKKGNTEMADAVNAALKALKDDGTLDRINDEWIATKEA